MRSLLLCGLVLASPSLAQEDAGFAPVATDGASAAVSPDAGLPPPDAGAFSASVGAVARVSGTLGTAFPLDDTGLRAAPSPLETRFRLTSEAHLRGFGLALELDAVTGALLGTPGSTVVAARVPTPGVSLVELRELYLEYRWATGVARLGQQTSQFGLGILSNAGKSDGEAGDFGQQHFGTLALRALVVSRPLFGLGGAWRAVEPVLAFDLVVRDSTANLYAGDRAFQGIVGLRFHVDDERLVSLTGIYRNQSPAPNPGLERTSAWVVDLAGQWRFFDSLDVGVELVQVLGSTTQARTTDFPLLTLRQTGAVGKASWQVGTLTLRFDAGYASGDVNPYDGELTSFRFDRDYKVGLVLFDQVLGWQSARTAFRAADRNLVGVAPEGLHLLPTGGAVTGAAYAFPRVSWAATDWLDVYGGGLFALATAPLTDAFNTRVLSGGVPVNSLGGPGQGYLGTECDLGVSAHWKTTHLSLRATVEAGVLLPGAAFTQASGAVMGPVWLGRARLTAGGF